jgi:hypothetical protein
MASERLENKEAVEKPNEEMVKEFNTTLDMGKELNGGKDKLRQDFQINHKEWCAERVRTFQWESQTKDWDIVRSILEVQKGKLSTDKKKIVRTTTTQTLEMSRTGRRTKIDFDNGKFTFQEHIDTRGPDRDYFETGWDKVAWGKIFGEKQAPLAYHSENNNKNPSTLGEMKECLQQVNKVFESQQLKELHNRIMEKSEKDLTPKPPYNPKKLTDIPDIYGRK